MAEPGELDALVAGEIERRLALLTSSEANTADVRAALHSLKGSAALAGHTDLAIVIGQLSSRVRDGSEGAVQEAAALLAEVRERLLVGLPPFATSWPEPPPGFGPSAIDVRYRLDYLSAMRDRLSELDIALASEVDAQGSVERAYRSVHAMKGAAGAVGDDGTAWYCHGLEAWLRDAAASEQRARDALVELARHRGILALFFEQPAHALETLRLLCAPQPNGGSLRPTPPSRPPASRSTRPPPLEAAEEENESFLRVATSTVDGFLERLERVDLVHTEMLGAAGGAHQTAIRLRELRASLLDALRLLGPPQPWGVPESALTRIDEAAKAVAGTAEQLERSAAGLRKNAELLHTRAREMRGDLGSLRRTSVGWVFTRVAHAVERLAMQEGKLVEVELFGSEITLDRRMAERLLDPLVQLARNAVAHGIQTPEERLRQSKSPIGKVELRAERMGDWLRLVIEDDGRGVDLEQVRQLALARGAVSAEHAGSTEPDELLPLLFLPGLTTREGADLLAGRGVGLELAQDAARRLGGAIRLQSKSGGGLVATLDVPSERGVLEVLWLQAAELQFALPVSFTGRVHPITGDSRPVHVAECLGFSSPGRGSLALELVIQGVQPVTVAVDAIFGVEEAIVRPLPPLAALAGPYAGAILRSDGSLRLALDAALLAARAYALLVSPS